MNILMSNFMSLPAVVQMAEEYYNARDYGKVLT